MKRMTSVVACFGLVLCLGRAAGAAPTEQPWNGEQVAWTFDDVPVGGLPYGWEVEATRQAGSLATWEVVADETAPSDGRALALTSPNHTSRGTFNVCWTNGVSILDGEVEVRFKAHTGKIDQGGGVIWRAQDRHNYYIARYNPLEDNLRIYYVLDGDRTMLANADISLAAGEWHVLKVVQRRADIHAYLNGEKLLETTDERFTAPGGIGLWTKADAVTSFDDLVVRMSRVVAPR
jgi:hypothetical protein